MKPPARLRRPLALSAAAVLALAPAVAPAFQDPFGTAALTAPSRLGETVTPPSASPCAAPLPAAAISLTDVVDRALCANPQTREAWANARVRAAEVGVARSAFLPSLDASVSWNSTNPDSAFTVADGWRSSTRAAATLSYLLYDFGRRDAELESARELLFAANATQESIVQQVFLQAVSAYYQVQAAEAALAAARASEQSSLEGLNAAQARYSVGAGTPADRLQAQTAHSQAVLDRIRAEGALRNASGTLANVMGLDANRPLALAPAAAGLPDLEREQDIGALIAQARGRRPDLAASSARARAAEADIRAAEAAGRPSVTLGAGPTFSDPSGGGLTDSSTVGVTLSIPLFTGFRDTYRIAGARAQAEATAAARDRVDLQVTLDVWQAYQSLTTESQAVKSSDDLLASALEAEQVALGRYRAGVGSILDVLNAQAALASARQQRVQASLNWNVARVSLAQSIGALDYDLIIAAGAASPGTLPAPR
jgi:TolC family type I secretion outer membrane protein